MGDLYSAVRVSCHCAWLSAPDIFTLGVRYRHLKHVQFAPGACPGARQQAAMEGLRVFAHTILRALALMYVKPPAIGVSQFSLDKKKHGVHN
ncbi:MULTISPECIES: hypothetical protein [Pseudomonas]|uniref:Uncharacterized protein n=2 Tax=Pseudomonas TaxID=286 RepID=A0AAW4C2I5_PSEPU|nr:MULTISPECIES: hypothetical protein [Pseudomonas]MRF39265.1 hypothetical protein [Escherichia coli]MBF8647749.1 hypothetical protein [Pseudomonas pudica]MBF8704757.1 hypothetical protein [Pseudomonas putida]MBF8710540.1 hypothetical protein [Pseudomonas putida]MBF8739050.1 hypothetical protein [Pseudomonas putida]